MSTKQNHKRWRQQFNQDCLTRDKHKCVFCNITEDLDVHHITNRHRIPNGGYVLSNGITVCQDHHMLCEMSNDDNFTFEILYKLINSSAEKAFSDSLKLN